MKISVTDKNDIVLEKDDVANIKSEKDLAVLTENVGILFLKLANYSMDKVKDPYTRESCKTAMDNIACYLMSSVEKHGRG